MRTNMKDDTAYINALLAESNDSNDTDNTRSGIQKTPEASNSSRDPKGGFLYWFCNKVQRSWERWPCKKVLEGTRCKVVGVIGSDKTNVICPDDNQVLTTKGLCEKHGQCVCLQDALQWQEETMIQSGSPFRYYHGYHSGIPIGIPDPERLHDGTVQTNHNVSVSFQQRNFSFKKLGVTLTFHHDWIKVGEWHYEVYGLGAEGEDDNPSNSISVCRTPIGEPDPSRSFQIGSTIKTLEELRDYNTRWVRKWGEKTDYSYVSHDCQTYARDVVSFFGLETGNIPTREGWYLPYMAAGGASACHIDITNQNDRKLAVYTYVKGRRVPGARFMSKDIDTGETVSVWATNGWFSTECTGFQVHIYEYIDKHTWFGKAKQVQLWHGDVVANYAYVVGEDKSFRRKVDFPAPPIPIADPFPRGAADMISTGFQL